MRLPSAAPLLLLSPCPPATPERSEERAERRTRRLAFAVAVAVVAFRLSPATPERCEERGALRPLLLPLTERTRPAKGATTSSAWGAALLPVSIHALPGSHPELNGQEDGAGAARCFGWQPVILPDSHSSVTRKTFSVATSKYSAKMAALSPMSTAQSTAQAIAYAHTSKLRDPETLSDHADKVAELAETFVAKFAAGWGRALSLLHDAGKYQPDFQTYLFRDSEAYDESKRGSVPHSIVGAALAWQALQTNSDRCYLLSNAVASHHGSLKEWTVLKKRMQEAGARVAAARQGGMPEGQLLSAIPADLPAWAADPFALPMGVRILFSALVDADLLATEAWDKGTPRETCRASISDLTATLDAYLEEKSQQPAKGAAELKQLRTDISDLCRSAAEQPQGAFRLTVPTGGGKTLSGMRFALHHAAKHGMARVIVVIPYTSILEQTAHQYREVFSRLDPHCIVEHHSALDPDGESQQNRQACENWDAPIIVTTSVQFFESLYAGDKKRCRKLHRIANSVVLLDEVQTFPPGMLQPIRSALRLLTKHFASTSVSMTATQPALSEGVAEREIVPEPRNFYAVVKQRFRLEWLAPPNEVIEWETLLTAVEPLDTAMVIVHRRAEAAMLAKKLGERCFHLSARMCAGHRQDVLRTIRQRLDTGQPCLLVATQLVEAGVDIDFPVVFRAFAGIETLAQAAGRCNRELSPIQGRFVVFRAPSEPPAQWLRLTLKTALLYWQRKDFDLKDPELFPRYMADALEISETDVMQVLTYERKMDFPEVASRFRMIEEDATIPVIAPYGEGWHRVEQLRAAGPTKSGLRRLQPFTVNLYERDIANLLKCGLQPLLSATYPSKEARAWVLPEKLQPAMYHEKFGFLTDADPELGLALGM
jgi:CRISPR-associated endonuclease/helicase Cas3